MRLRCAWAACGLIGVLAGALPCHDAKAGDTEATRSTAAPPAWWLRLPKDEKVAFRGVVNFDQAGVGNNSFLYPAPNAVGLLVAVLTHAAIVDSAKNSQKQKLQEKADQVLAPYQGILADYRHAELMKRGLEKTTTAADKHLVGSQEQPGPGWTVDSTPVFSMTQDQTAIVLDNTIAIVGAGGKDASFQGTVRIVSAPLAGADRAGLWTANGGEKLKEESSSLFAESLDIAARHAGGGLEGKGVQRTFRYFEGGTERMERAELLADLCSRLVLKTLRGDIMSVPARRPADAEPCAPAGAK